jgi:hypothetical protein
MHAAWAALLCLLLPMLVAVPARAADVVTAAEFVRRIDDARALAAEAAGTPSPGKMDEVRGRLGLPLVVELGSAQRIDVPGDPVLDALEGKETADFTDAARHLSELSAAVDKALDVPAIDAVGVKDALDRSYAGIRTTPSFSERISRWIQDRIDRFTAWIGQRIDGAPVLWGVIKWLFLGVCALLVVYVTVRLARQVGLVPAGDRTLIGEPVERVDWARAAEEALARGEAREAVRALYRLLVEILTERGLVPNLPSLTPAECRTAVRRHVGRDPGSAPAHDLMAAIDRATSAFERVVYGRTAASAADVEALRAGERAARAA